MADLFQRSGLEQDTGRISQRWGQDGSTIFNNTANRASDVQIVAVTANKVLYVDSIVINNIGTGVGASFTLKDGGAAGTAKFSYTTSAVQGDTVTINLNTPLKFETDIYFDEGTAGINVGLTLSGWEE